MTATTKPTRAMTVITQHYGDDFLMLGVAVRDNGRFDGYYVTHAADSCEVRWEHEHDARRSYTVTCSPADGSPYRCTCPARVPCRHRLATTALAERGLLRLPRLTDAGHDRSPTE